MHKLVTGRRDLFTELKQEGGLSGYPSRAESDHDQIENSHASTALSYAHGIATALRLEGRTTRRRAAARHRRRRRRRAHRWHGLRGAQQPRALRCPGARGAERQRPQLRPDRLEALRLAHPPPPRPPLRRSCASGCARCSRSSRPAWAPSPTSRSTGSPPACGRSSSRTCSSRRSASATPGRSTATTSAPSRRSPCSGRRNGTVRSSCTCSPPRARATRRRRPTTSPGFTTSRCPPSRWRPPPRARPRPRGRSPGRWRSSRRRCRASGRPPTTPARSLARSPRATATPRPSRAPSSRWRTRRADRRDHRGDARTDRAVGVRGPLPGAFRRRRHRRAARLHRGRRHGHGRPPPGRGGVLDLHQPGVRPVEPRHRAPPVARGGLRGPRRDHRRRRTEPPRHLRPGPGLADSRLRHLLPGRAG